jgi:hypothetical protein
LRVVTVDKKARLAKARDIQRAIAQILLRDWDPIHVKDEPQAQDEYDGYVGGVYRLLVSGAGPQTVAEHLCRVEAESMGYDQAHPSDLLPVAEKLCKLDVRLEKEEA